MKRMRKVRQRNLLLLRRLAIKRTGWPTIDWGPPWHSRSHVISKTHRFVHRAFRKEREANRLARKIEAAQRVSMP